jgi:hypothetical protein
MQPGAKPAARKKQWPGQVRQTERGLARNIEDIPLYTPWLRFGHSRKHARVEKFIVCNYEEIDSSGVGIRVFHFRAFHRVQRG